MIVSRCFGVPRLFALGKICSGGGCGGTVDLGRLVHPTQKYVACQDAGGMGGVGGGGEKKKKLRLRARGACNHFILAFDDGGELTLGLASLFANVAKIPSSKKTLSPCLRALPFAYQVGTLSTYGKLLQPGHFTLPKVRGG